MFPLISFELNIFRFIWRSFTFNLNRIRTFLLIFLWNINYITWIYIILKKISLWLIWWDRFAIIFFNFQKIDLVIYFFFQTNFFRLGCKCIFDYHRWKSFHLLRSLKSSYFLFFVLNFLAVLFTKYIPHNFIILNL